MSVLKIVQALQSSTGCTWLEAMNGARIAIDHCQSKFTVTPQSQRVGRHGECLVIRKHLDPDFLENWSDHIQGRERCDELNRDRIWPLYYIAHNSAA
jgi:hypothetical protein